MERLSRAQISKFQPLILALLLILLVIIATILQPRFLSYFHISVMLYGSTMLGILALGQTLCILSGGLDLSIGSIYWVTIMIGAVLMGSNGLLISIVVCLAIGALIGLINGIGISRLNIPHVVMTLAMMIFLTGTLYITTGGGGKGKAAEALIKFSTMRVFKFPIITVVWIGLTVLLYFVTNRTSFGWRVRSLGSNMRASYFSGINVSNVQTIVYVISGILAAIAGILYLGWARTPYPTFQGGAGVGANIMLESVAAVIIGGTLFSGGRGGVLRTVLGVLFVAVLSSMLSMMGLGFAWKLILHGLIILIVVGVHSQFKT